MQPQARHPRELLTQGLADSDYRDVAGKGRAQGHVGDGSGSVVVDDHGGGSGGDREVGLDRKRAGEVRVRRAAQHQSDVPCREARPVRCEAPARVTAGNADGRRHIAAAGVRQDIALERAGRRRCHPLQHWRCQVDEGLELERLSSDIPPGGEQPVLDVVDGLVVAGRPGHPGASVVVRDLLEGFQVLGDACQGDALLQLGGVVVVSRVTFRRRRGGVHRGQAARDDQGSGGGDGEGGTMYSGFHRETLSLPASCARTRGPAATDLTRLRSHRSRGAPEPCSPDRAEATTVTCRSRPSDIDVLAPSVAYSRGDDRSVPGSFLKDPWVRSWVDAVRCGGGSGRSGSRVHSRPTAT